MRCVALCCAVYIVVRCVCIALLCSLCGSLTLHRIEWNVCEYGALLCAPPAWLRKLTNSEKPHVLPCLDRQKCLEEEDPGCCMLKQLSNLFPCYSCRAQNAKVKCVDRRNQRAGPCIARRTCSRPDSACVVFASAGTGSAFACLRLRPARSLVLSTTHTTAADLSSSIVA